MLKGFRGDWARKFQKAKRRKEKKITYTVHGFPIAMQGKEWGALCFGFWEVGSQSASLVKDVILPYSHLINTYNGNVGIENHKSLMFFMESSI
ncbi:probable arabinosyltransferase ARAD1 [Olea europaea subsp. europaea]|uniref:Probable arabinosyltransferase ARAD1 n=1 Tax=Olea europaea subsp. europaea TaxID=158383 RepID=A0A8S0QSI6_OLEEU|nr:probable arabinosyltransferase ARAD1 [Olea europaea subsp. europaea]